MKIKTKELASLIEYGFESYLKPYSIVLSRLSLGIDNNIHLKASVLYKDKKINVNLLLNLHCCNNDIIIQRINGEVLYNGYRLPYMNILNHLNKSKYLHVKNDKIVITYDLPIADILIKTGYIDIHLKDTDKRI